MRSFRSRKPLPITFEKMFMRAGFRMTKINVNFRHPEPCSREHFSNMFLNFLARTIARLSEHPRNNISCRSSRFPRPLRFKSSRSHPLPLSLQDSTHRTPYRQLFSTLTIFNNYQQVPSATNKQQAPICSTLP